MTKKHDRPTVEQLNERAKGHFPEYLGIVAVHAGERTFDMEMRIKPELLAPNNFLHAGSIVTLADTAAGYGCLANLPEGADSFTTIELKSNFLGTAREGLLKAHARAAHLGRMTQIWDVTVTHTGTGKALALFRCTQMILWPK
jgi:uncharacterized protein (TIGR00369 family)